MISSDTAWPAPNHQQSGEGSQSHKFFDTSGALGAASGFQADSSEIPQSVSSHADSACERAGYEMVDVKTQAYPADNRIHFLKTH